MELTSSKADAAEIFPVKVTEHGRQAVIAEMRLILFLEVATK